MSPPGLPRNGLVALYDPYRDTYGRNVLTSGYQYFDMGIAGLTRSDATGGYWQFLESATDDFHRIVWPTAAVAAGVGFMFSLRVRAVGVTQFMIRVVRGSDPFESAIFNLSTGAVTSCHANLTASITDAGGGEFICTVYVKPTASAVGSIQFGKEVRSTYLGTAGQGFVVGFPQLNLGSTLFPYAAPSGAPGTLQTLTDYSGHSNTGTLGASTDVGADDPSFTGTSLLFGGDDYVVTTVTPAKLDANLPMTMLAVFKVPAFTGATQRVVSFSNVSGLAPAYNGRALLFKSSDNLKLSAHSYASSDIFSSQTVTAGDIIVGAMRYDGSKQSVFVNGVKYDEKDAPSVTLHADSNLRLGRSQDLSGFFTNSDIHLCAVWQQSLSEPEMMRVYLYLKSLMAGRGVTVA